MTAPTRAELGVILLAGGLVSAAPAVWANLAWGHEFAPSIFAIELTTSVFVVTGVLSLVPFVGLALFRRARMIGRWPAALAAVLAGAAVVLMQFATLDPHGASSTQAIGFVFIPVYGVVMVAVLAALDGIARAVSRRFRSS